MDAPIARIRGRASPLFARLLPLLVVVCGLETIAGPVTAQRYVDQRLEYNVKAVALYGFARYVKWPAPEFADQSSPFVIGLLGGNPFESTFQVITATKTIEGHPIIVRQLVDPAEATMCHIVFLTKGATAGVEANLFAVTAGRPILLVGETPGFASRGGILNFYFADRNVRYELNIEKLNAVGLTMDAKMLSLCTKAKAP